MATGPPTVGPKPPLVTVPQGRAVGRTDLRALAGGRLALGPEPDQLARRPLLELAQDDLGTGEAALLAPPLADRPGEPGLDRGGGGVDVVAVERQAGLQAQRVARTQAGRAPPPARPAGAGPGSRRRRPRPRSRSRPRRCSRGGRHGRRCRPTSISAVVMKRRSAEAGARRAEDRRRPAGPAGRAAPGRRAR